LKELHHQSEDNTLPGILRYKIASPLPGELLLRQEFVIPERGCAIRHACKPRN
jgi:hypothetical protein